MCRLLNVTLRTPNLNYSRSPCPANLTFAGIFYDEQTILSIASVGATSCQINQSVVCYAECGNRNVMTTNKSIGSTANRLLAAYLGSDGHRCNTCADGDHIVRRIDWCPQRHV